MIVSCLGYGYVSSYLLKEIASNGINCIGITDNLISLNKKTYGNISVLPRRNTEEVIDFSTHLVIAAPPQKSSCPVLYKFQKKIKNSNIRSVVYISTTGVYGDHQGKWVDENSSIKGENNIFDKSRINAEKNWIHFCKKSLITLNIVRLGAIYGPGRPKTDDNFFKNIIIKNNHFFSRVHVFDISRLITKILLNCHNSACWNIVDELPSTRKDFVERIINLKNVKNYNFIMYGEKNKYLKTLKNKFWLSNKKVSAKKIKKYFKYSYLFPTYVSGLKHVIKNS